jgi:murein L,D-transpeptidase YafK
MVMIEEHPICAASGLLGPKRRFGDRQVPEGIYEIDYLNPRSAYHLSLRIDYPNASDRVRGDRSALGGAIMVHGDCVSIGCIAIEDGPIERVFVSVEAARRAGKKRVPIHIFPRRMDDAGRAALEGAAPPDSDRARLWSELRPIYAAFETSRRVPEVVIDRATGAYRLAGPRRSNDA